MTAPEKIYGWLNTQMSIARHYGGLTYNGASYVIAYDEPDQPLVRIDTLKKAVKENKKTAALKRKAEKAKWENVPGLPF